MMRIRSVLVRPALCAFDLLQGRLSSFPSLGYGSSELSVVL